MAEQESDKKSDEPVDEELEYLLKEVTDPLPTGNLPKPVIAEAGIVPADPEPTEEPDSVDNNIKIIIDKFHGVTDKIINNYDCDRDELGDAVDRLRDMMMSSKKVSGYVIEGYVSALKTKTDANTNIIKLLDAFAKIISSTKNTSIISQATNIDLSDLLDNDEDDE